MFLSVFEYRRFFCRLGCLSLSADNLFYGMMLRAITNPRTFLRIALADFAEVDLRENFESVVGILGRVLPGLHITASVLPRSRDK